MAFATRQVPATPETEPRPWLLRIGPLTVREKVFYRLFYKTAHRHEGWFRQAPLHFAPHIKLDLYPTDAGHRAIAALGFYELAVTRRIARLAERGGLFVDVGANWGYYSCLWAAARPSNQVIAFEASPRNARALQRNVQANSLSDRVVIEEVALGRANERMTFSQGPTEQTGWGGLSLDAQSESVEVDVRRLDDYISARGDEGISVLKIDVEGADAWVLEGAEHLFAEGRVEHVFFELNLPRMAALGIDPQACHQLLKRWDYQLEELAPGEWYARRRR